ncbi:aa3-type cytochrome oxidase subunit IV [Thermogemmatispora onikobensis]|uniref:aa3-type cytochrome oxidase subunit IV n=1 Tax=Thermogemmatispora onikobensis TaxID=732234 RepID=UPI00114D197E|nr:cytochrome c oxidase subunit 4 [Thermogemmatispora onikobensis]
MQQQPQEKSGEAAAANEEQPRPAPEGASEQSQGRPSRARTPRGPHASLWPFVLALAIALACLGVVTHPAVLVIGALLIVVAVVGWGLERY